MRFQCPPSRVPPPRNGSQKWYPNGSQKRYQKRVPKWNQRAPKGFSRWGPEKGLKKGTLLGGPEVRFCYYLLYFSKVGPLRKGSLLGVFFGFVLDPKLVKKGPDEHS